MSAAHKSTDNLKLSWFVILQAVNELFSISEDANGEMTDASSSDDELALL